MVFTVTFSSLAYDHDSINVAVEPAFESKQLWKTKFDIISLFPVKGVSLDLSVFFEIMVVMSMTLLKSRHARYNSTRPCLPYLGAYFVSVSQSFLIFSKVICNLKKTCCLP